MNAPASLNFLSRGIGLGSFLSSGSHRHTSRFSKQRDASRKEFFLFVQLKDSSEERGIFNSDRQIPDHRGIGNVIGTIKEINDWAIVEIPNGRKFLAIKQPSKRARAESRAKSSRGRTK